MIKIFKILITLLIISYSSSINAKPVPPGAGEGDVPANILFLVDSSASMGNRIGQGVRTTTGFDVDTEGRFIIGQQRNGGIIRWLADGSGQDTDFRTIRQVSNAGCRFGLSIRGNGANLTNNTGARAAVRSTSGLTFVENLQARGQTNNAFFVAGRDRNMFNRIFGFSEDGTTCLFHIIFNFNRAVVSDFDVRMIDGNPILFATGRWSRRGRSVFFVSCNLNNAQCNTNAMFNQRFNRIAVNNAGDNLYATNTAGNLLRYDLANTGTLTELGNNNFQCFRSLRPNLNTQMAVASDVREVPGRNDQVYIVSHISHAIQKITLSGTRTCTIESSVGMGRRSRMANEGDSGTLAANQVGFNGNFAIRVTDTRIYTATQTGYIDVLDEDIFQTSRDTAWLQQFGGPAISRWTGVKNAIRSIVNDTTLTTGAHFGFGHWNAGEHGGPRTARMGGRHCHRNPDCTYYQSWSGSHPLGTSTQCNRDSCLNVAISSAGAGRIMSVLNPLGLAWGTDAHAFSQLAEDYFNDPRAGGSVFDEDSECQLNYVIVIGDGAMNNTGVLGARGQTAQRMARLRGKGIKSLYVAYGGGITGRPLQRFDELARIGSCASPGDDDCEETIEAATPAELKQQLTSKIRQIIADKLAFTAPSITATIQEGGSLYQAQFEYEQFGEWKGKLLRKKLNTDGSVEHDTSPNNSHGNWNAAFRMRQQSTDGDTRDDRFIWTALGSGPDCDDPLNADNPLCDDDASTIDYLKNWDNFKVEFSDEITPLLELFGYPVADYHHENSSCTGVGSNGTSDDIDGLIKFMKGNDYFDYNGNCNIEEVRDHVMGDIYHSQLVEIGPPDANIVFNNTNEEAYFRAKKNYQGFMANHAARQKIIYAGSNSGCLHAIDAISGDEEWCFIPPFVVGLLPQIINKDYEGKTDGSKGGTNPIFGVDGSIVVHDVYMKSYNMEGEEIGPEWRTILFVPYGRGGSGFSVLDVTNPIILDGKGPIHLFSVYNDQVGNRVLIADYRGDITSKPYNNGSSSYLQTEEGMVALNNYAEARAGDENEQGDSDVEITTRQDAIAACSTDADFRNSGQEAGGASCYIGDTFHFPDIVLNYPDRQVIPGDILTATEIVNGDAELIGIASAMMVDGMLRVQFTEDKVINAVVSELEPRGTNEFNISTACKGATNMEPKFDYTQLGETWSTPRILRVPSFTGGENGGQISTGGSIDDDVYVAVMGGGMSKNDSCAGSAIYLVEIANLDEPGSIYGAEANGGPITIVDTTPMGLIDNAGTFIDTPGGSDIPNAIPATPVVITPDTAFNIPWRGGMVYINDLEGKITKINLTSSTKNGAELFDQTTLINLGANLGNARLSFFGMDAGVGVDDGVFMLFGSTGDFTNLGGREPGMDNLLYGVMDPDYPDFRHLNGVIIPKGSTNNFKNLAHAGAAGTDTTYIDDENQCVNVTGEDDNECPKLIRGQKAWVVKLEQNEDGNFHDPRLFRKASASPTMFKGQVYFPVYQPPVGQNVCNQGSAFVCVHDDECGTNTSGQLGLETPPDVPNPGANACAFVRKGVLSELVIFSDKLFANVAGPTGDEDTLFSILSIPGEIIQNKGGWKDSSF